MGRSFMDRFFIERRSRRIGCAATANITIVILVIFQSAKAHSHTVRTIIAERCRNFLDTSGGTETILRMINTDEAHKICADDVEQTLQYPYGDHNWHVEPFSSELLVMVVVSGRARLGL